MKQKIIELIAFMCYFTSLVYISGQYGALECDAITNKQFIIRTGLGLVILAIGLILSNIDLKKKPMSGCNHIRGRDKKSI